MTTTSWIFLILTLITSAAAWWYRYCLQGSIDKYINLCGEHETDLEDIKSLQSANEDFKKAHDQIAENNQKLVLQIQQLQQAAQTRERYINEVIQPMIFNRRQKFMSLDGLTYELYSVCEMITKYPTCINIIPVNLWDQITDELVTTQAFELLRQLQTYRKTYPFKFTKIPFGECFYRAPLWNLPS